jgi:hypothetical protein
LRYLFTAKKLPKYPSKEPDKTSRNHKKNENMVGDIVKLGKNPKPKFEGTKLRWLRLMIIMFKTNPAIKDEANP